jgi:hypothetical protein
MKNKYRCSNLALSVPSPRICHQISSGDKVKKDEGKHVVRIARREYRVLVGKLEGRGHLEELRVDGRVILKLIFKKWDGRA